MKSQFTIRISEKFKTINRRNPISGHEWTEPGKTTGFFVHTPGGTIAARTHERAERLRAEWQAFYDKFFPAPSRSPA